MQNLKFEVFSMSSTVKKQRHYEDKTIKILYGAAVGRCTKCKTNLLLRDDVGNIQQIGEIAHIYPFGEKNAPRYKEIEIDGLRFHLQLIKKFQKKIYNCLKHSLFLILNSLINLWLIRSYPSKTDCLWEFCI